MRNSGAAARLVVRGGTVLAPDGRRRADVAIVGGRIESVGADLAPGDTEIDAAGRLVAPGLVDLQVNGGWGHDVTSDGGAMWPLAERLARHGVTAFLPTVVTSPPHCADDALAALAAPPVDHLGATPLGLHLEGPMIAPARRGAHRAEHIRLPDTDLVAGWSRDGGVTMVTLAPELAGAREVIRALVARGVVVAAGHSDATVDDVRAGVEAGVTQVTHLFNAMAPFTHRAPGLVGAALARGDLTVGLIVDGHHVHPTAVAAAWNAKGADGITLVSDSVAALGLPAHEHRLGDRAVLVDGETVRTSDGTLAGSAITLLDGVRNLVRFTGCPVDDALRAATATPARVIRSPDRGRLSPGAHGDLVVLTDDLEVVTTIVGGRPVAP